VKTVSIIISALFCILAACSFAGVAQALDFSADMVSTAKASGSMSGRIFVAKDKVRMEAGGAITITRTDKGVSWVIIPGQNVFIEQQVDPNKIAGATEKMPGEIERTLLGPDAVDGRPVNKYRIVYTSRMGNAAVFQWIDTATGIPLKTEASDGSWSMEYKNLAVGRQPEAIFEIPAQYRKMTIPTMPGMAGMAAAATNPEASPSDEQQ